MIETLTSLIKENSPSWSPQYIAELGANDGTQTLELYHYYQDATILAMEPSPNLALGCRQKFQDKPRIIFLDKACTESEGTIKFQQSITANLGIGSIFRPTGKYPLEELKTTEIEVQSTRLETVMAIHQIPQIDLFWLDCQGAELQILRSMGKNLHNTTYIYSEYMTQPIYEGQPLFSDLDKFLCENGFIQIWRKTAVENWFGDTLYYNPSKNNS